MRSGSHNLLVVDRIHLLTTQPRETSTSSLILVPWGTPLLLPQHPPSSSEKKGYGRLLVNQIIRGNEYQEKHKDHQTHQVYQVRKSLKIDRYARLRYSSDRRRVTVPISPEQAHEQGVLFRPMYSRLYLERDRRRKIAALLLVFQFGIAIWSAHASAIFTG